MDVHNQSEVVVIAVPFPTQSHLNQLLQFSCLISSYNIPVYFAGSVTHIRQAKLRFSNKNRLTNDAKIHFHEFPTPHFLSPEPNPSDKFPNHLLPSYEATLQLREPMASFLNEISPTAKRVVVLHDYVMSYVVQDTTTLPNAETYVFNPISPFSFFFDRWESMGKPFPVEEAEGLPSPETSYVCGGIADFVSLQSESQKFTSGTIFNSCRSIEGKYIDYLTSEPIGGNKQVWAIGPLNQMVDTVYEDRDNSSSSSNSRHKCLEWLDKQAPRSVLYVTFGTTTSMKDEQIKELALGLEQSQQKFIWVFRDADKGNIFEGDLKRSELPEGYEERVKGVGLVIRDWAPQQEILGHLSVGGFMSHCGWNSCMESITMGVPILAWPMHSDQPRNAFLLTDILKIGLLVISQLEQQEEEEELVTSSTIAKAIKRLMASKEGEEIRKRAEEVGDVTQQAVKEGGVSRMELDSFIAHITR